MYKLPELPYPVDALEPYIDALTMEIHHDRHNRAYVNNLNKALQGHPEIQKMSLIDILKHLNDIPESIRRMVRDNGGGTYNHAFFWEIMSPKGGGAPKGTLADELRKRFDSFDSFTSEFNDVAKSVFGSGWAWLVVNKEGTLDLMSTPNQDCPISYGATPIIGLDVWEHAYYLQYQNHRPDYIYAWWNVVNWDRAEEYFRQVK
jgi:superoxide dismutase, Fe-Mn family